MGTDNYVSDSDMRRFLTFPDDPNEVPIVDDAEVLASRSPAPANGPAIFPRCNAARVICARLRMLGHRRGRLSAVTRLPRSRRFTFLPVWA